MKTQQPSFITLAVFSYEEQHLVFFFFNILLCQTKQNCTCTILDPVSLFFISATGCLLSQKVSLFIQSFGDMIVLELVLFHQSIYSNFHCQKLAVARLQPTLPALCNSVTWTECTDMLKLCVVLVRFLFYVVTTMVGFGHKTLSVIALDMY